MMRIIGAISCIAIFAIAVPGIAASGHVGEAAAVAHVALAGGQWDYTRIDKDHHRVVVAITNDDKTGRIDAVPLGGGKPLTLSHQSVGVHIAVPAEGLSRLVVSRDDHQVAVVDSATGRTLKLIEVGSASDGGVFDARRRLVYLTGDGVRKGDAGIIVIDPVDARLVKRIELAGRDAEAPALDAQGHFYFVDYDNNALVLVDLMAGKVKAAVPLPGCTHPKGLAIDDDRASAYIACAGGRLVAVSLSAKRVIGGVAIPQGTDGLVYDGARRRAFLVALDKVAAINLDDPRRPRVAAQFKIAKYSAGGAYDASTGRYYVPMANYTGFKVVDGQIVDGGKQTSGSVEMAVFDMRKLP